MLGSMLAVLNNIKNINAVKGVRVVGEGDKRMLLGFFLRQTVLRWKKQKQSEEEDKQLLTTRCRKRSMFLQSWIELQLYPFPSYKLCWHDALTEAYFVVDEVLWGLQRCTTEDNSRYCRGDLRWLAAYGYTAVQMPFTLVIWLPSLVVHCIITDSDATVCYCLYLGLKVDERVSEATFSELHELRKQIC